jgi:ribonuclease Z
MVTTEGKKVTCLGDEPYNPLCRGFVEGSDWLLCEAFCLYSQRDRFKPYEKHHSTVREACQLAQELEIPHLVLWHTEDENYSQRKTLYMEEGRGYYNGDLHVPYDLEVIDLV